MTAIQLKPVAPAQAIAYFRQKGFRIGFDYRDVWQQEHQAAFTVAKAMQIDLLKDIRGELDKALAEGLSFADFQKALTPRLQARGWWGRQEVVDPVTGKTVTAQLGSPRRLKIIYGTNLATAYSEGQWERIQQNEVIFPFLEYVRSASANPRDSHLAYAGLVLPVGDPFWQAHLPIKEYNCKCTVISHTRRTLEREGLKVGQAPPEEWRKLTNQRTGEVMTVPKGVHPSFHYPPGGRRAKLGEMMMDKAQAGAAATTARVLSQGVERWLPLVQTEFSEFVARYAEGERREVGSRRVAGVMPAAMLDRLHALGLTPKSAAFSVNMDKLSHLLGKDRGEKRRAKGSGVEFVSSLPTLLTQIGEAWLDGKQVILLTACDQPGMVAKVAVALDDLVRRTERVNRVVSMELIDPVSFTRQKLTQLL